MRLAVIIMVIGTALANPAWAACHVTESSFGVHGVNIWRIENGQMGASVLTLGGILYELDVPDANGQRDNVVRNLGSLNGYEQRDNFSSLIGRYANRIGGGGINLEGRFYPLAANAKGITIHGGTKSFGSRLWSARRLSAVEGCGIELSLVSPDGDNGFPGALGVQVRYTVKGKALRLDYQARTTKLTVVNLTDHAYFNLAGHGDVYAQTLQVNAAHYLPLNALHLPTGEMAPVAGTAYDLRSARPLQDLKALDDTFVLNGEGLKIAAILRDPASGRRLTVRTTAPGLVVYTGSGFDGTLTDAKGEAIQAGAGIALETQAFPDSPNHANFPTTELRPGQTWRSTTVFDFR